MKIRQLLLFAISMTISMTCFSQVDLPYYTGFNTAQETDGWTEFRLGETTEEFYTWELINNFLSHNYPVGGSEITDDWMVSPEFDFSQGAVIDSLMFKSGGFGTPSGVDTIAVYLINGNQNPSEASSIILLHLFTDANYQNDNVWRTFYDLPIDPIAGKSYLAFRYKTIVNWLDVVIDDIYIRSIPLGIYENENKLHGILAYPNPTSDFLFLKTKNKLNLSEINLLDFNGKIIKRFNPTDRELDIAEIPSGLYFLKIMEKDKVFVRKVVVK